MAAMLAVLVPVIRAQGATLRREIEGQGESLRREMDTLRVDVGEVRRDLHVLSDRVARIEGACRRMVRHPPLPARSRRLSSSEHSAPIVWIRVACRRGLRRHSPCPCGT